MDYLNEMALFVEVAQANGFSRAAAKLGMPQSTLSRRIAALEDKATEELGQVKNRLTELETRLEHLPNREAIGNIHKRLDRQAETLHKMEGALDGVNDTSKLILEVLLKGDKS